MSQCIYYIRYGMNLAVLTCHSSQSRPNLSRNIPSSSRTRITVEWINPVTITTTTHLPHPDSRSCIASSIAQAIAPSHRITIPRYPAARSHNPV